MAMSPNGPKRPRDTNQLAKRIVDIATGAVSDEEEPPTVLEERASKGGKARASELTSEERSRIAQRAARARWASE